MTRRTGIFLGAADDGQPTFSTTAEVSAANLGGPVVSERGTVVGVALATGYPAAPSEHRAANASALLDFIASDTPGRSLADAETSPPRW
jgi:S1-C subfamily serine protease